MTFSENVLGRVMASADPMICRDKGFMLLKAGKAEDSVEWFSKAIRASPGNAALYWGRSMAWESAGKGRFAITDARIGVVLRPRVAAGFVRLSAACEAQGRYADAVRACYLGMRCGDPNSNTDLGRRMARVRVAGLLPPIDWKPVDWRERWCWMLLSLRALYLRVMAGAATRLRIGGEDFTLRICGTGGLFMRAPWPR